MEIKELEELIVYHQNAYYNGNAEISDAEFDALWDELKEKDPTNKLITSKVGKDESDFFPKTKHLMIMGSQEKANSKEEVEKKLAGMAGDGDYLIEWKLDGCVSKDTLVQTENGVKTIEEVVKGQDTTVLSYNEEEGKIEFKKILNKMCSFTNKKWFKIKLDDGTELKITENDYIRLINGAYRKVSDLNVGDIVCMK